MILNVPTEECSLEALVAWRDSLHRLHDNPLDEFYPCLPKVAAALKELDVLIAELNESQDNQTEQYEDPRKTAGVFFYKPQNIGENVGNVKEETYINKAHQLRH